MAMQHTVFVHVDLKTLLKPAGLALVPPSQVHHTLAVLLADVGQVPTDASLEEAPAAVTAEHAVVFTGAAVPTDLAKDIGLFGRGQRG